MSFNIISRSKMLAVVFALLGSMVALGLMIAAAKDDSWAVFLIMPLVFFGIYATVRFPEVLFALFLTAGAYKADPRLSFLGSFFDITVMLAILSMAGASYGLITKRLKIIKPPKSVTIPYLIIAALGIISLAYTSAPIYGTDKLLRFLTLTSLALFLPFVIFRDNRAVKRFFIVILLLALFMIVDVIGGGLTPGEFGFHSAFGSNYLAMGVILGSASIIVMFYFSMRTESKFMKIIYICLSPMILFGMLISGGRGPLFALIVSCLLVFVYMIFAYVKNILTFSKSDKKTAIILIPVIVLAIIGFVIVVNFPGYFYTLNNRISMAELTEGGSATGRMDRFKSAIEIMTDFPTALTGVGIGGFTVFYAGVDNQRGDYPHNIFLEFGSELGILGLCAIIMLIFLALFTSLFFIKKTDTNGKLLSLTLLTLLIFTLVNANVSGDINDNRMLFMWIGLIYASKDIVNAKD